MKTKNTSNISNVSNISKLCNFAIIFTLLLFVSVSSFADSKENKKTAEISIPSIQCGMCVKTIEKALGNVDGVFETDVDQEKLIVTVIYDDTKVSVENLEDVITAAGYDANEMPANEDAYNDLHSCCKKPDNK